MYALTGTSRTLNALRNFFKPFSTAVSQDYIQNTLHEIVKEGSKFGFHDQKFNASNAKTIIVEYSSPNIAKRFHAGHFRSTIVGHSISNILEAAGNKVIRMNYLGDWGMQFAILSVGFERHGNTDSLQTSPLRHLYDVYVKASIDIKEDPALKQRAQDIFYQMEQGDEKSLEFWKICRAASLKEFEQLYKCINITFDDYESESMYRSMAKDVLSDLRMNKLLIPLPNNTEGIDLSPSLWLYEKKPMTSPATLARSNGTSLYLTRDIAAAISRKERYDFDEMYYVTDHSQLQHFSQLFGILEIMGKKWAEPNSNTLHHKTFGRVQGMKTRQGEVVFFEDILDEAYRRVKSERLEHSTRKEDIVDSDSMMKTLGLSGLICNDLKSKLNIDYKFQWEIALQSKGNTGIFLQYTHSRLQSLKRSCGFELILDIDCQGLKDEETAVALIKCMASYSEVAWKVYVDLEPCYITQYMFQLCRLISQALQHLKVKGQDASVAQPRLLLFHCAETVLHNCMVTIGMTPLDKM